jgi:hypothetical protein
MFIHLFGSVIFEEEADTNKIIHKTKIFENMCNSKTIIKRFNESIQNNLRFFKIQFNEWQNKLIIL